MALSLSLISSALSFTVVTALPLLDYSWVAPIKASEIPKVLADEDSLLDVSPEFAERMNSSWKAATLKEFRAMADKVGQTHRLVPEEMVKLPSLHKPKHQLNEHPMAYALREGLGWNQSKVSPEKLRSAIMELIPEHKMAEVGMTWGVALSRYLAKAIHEETKQNSWDDSVNFHQEDTNTQFHHSFAASSPSLEDVEKKLGHVLTEEPAFVEGVEKTLEHVLTDGPRSLQDMEKTIEQELSDGLPSLKNVNKALDRALNDPPMKMVQKCLPGELTNQIEMIGCMTGFVIAKSIWKSSIQLLLPHEIEHMFEEFAFVTGLALVQTVHGLIEPNGGKVPLLGLIEDLIEQADKLAVKMDDEQIRTVEWLQKLGQSTAEDVGMRIGSEIVKEMEKSHVKFTSNVHFGKKESRELGSQIAKYLSLTIFLPFLPSAAEGRTLLMKLLDERMDKKRSAEEQMTKTGMTKPEKKQSFMTIVRPNGAMETFHHETKSSQRPVRMEH